MNSLTDKIRFEKLYNDYLECLKIPKENKQECKEVIKTFHYLSEHQFINGSFEITNQPSPTTVLSNK